MLTVPPVASPVPLVPTGLLAVRAPVMPSREDPVERVTTGEHLISRSGRAMAPVPRLTLGTDRQTLNSLARLNAWLLDEARAEALHTGTTYHTTLLRGLNARRLSPSDVDTLNLMLFDDERGPGPAHRQVWSPS